MTRYEDQEYRNAGRAASWLIRVNCCQTQQSGCRILNALILCFCLLFGAICVASSEARAQGETLRIGIIGDQSYAKDLDQAYSVLERGVAALNALKSPPEVVIHTGDLVESTQPETEVERRFQRVLGILGKLSVPWYVTAGDHDVNPPKFEQNSTDRSRETLFRNLYSQHNPKVARELYYSFDFKSYHFIALYSQEHLHTDPRWGNVFFSRITDDQYRWLEQDLASNGGGKDGIIVFLHQPLWYNWSGWSRVHRLLQQYPVRAVVAGHFHYNQSQAPLDGIQYWVVGASGGETKHGAANSGDLQHVTLLEVGNSGPAFTMIPLAPASQRDWTSRGVMDRLQAIDTILGNLFSFPANSPVHLREGLLVKGCGSAEPARLVVKGIGNATDLPAQVTIAVDAGPNVEIDGAAFGADLCKSSATAFSCELKPSAAIAVSNTSLVQLSQYPPAPPLWAATIRLRGDPPKPGAVIRIEVQMSFEAGGQTYMLRKDASTAIQPCQI